MNIPQTSTPLWMRFLGILIAITIILWLSIEDSTENIVVLFAVLICIWITTAIFSRKNTKASISFCYYILAGLLAGAAITPITLLLIVIKTGLHSHSVPDYTVQQILSVIWKTPIWLISGFSIGSGLGMWFRSQKH